MDPAPRHQCLIYEGPPSRHLSVLAEVVRQNLNENKRCLYLNSEPMVAGMRSYLAAAGVDVVHETANARLVLSSERHHLADGKHFDVEQMLDALDQALKQALRDGYEGLWATGDMTWELGPDRDFSKLLEYEWRLEEFFRANPRMSGLCQYHVETMPRHVARQGLQTHSSVFLNQTLSLLNPVYCGTEFGGSRKISSLEIDSFLNRVLQQPT
ncbi:MEDS domain-containing protein [Telmatobacter sp. DSM 110680]|uniref:MEDS domain-containing protein n=2 Tax=Telmatobacter sp. DSM 110680 TaxID=3036704 RepID=A0AAU7DIY3_9BACT